MKIKTFFFIIPLFLLFVFSQAPAQGETKWGSYNVRIKSVSPEIIKTDTTTTVKIRVENLGPAGLYEMTVTDSPSNWDVSMETSGFQWISGGDEKDYKVRITASGFQGVYPVEFTVRSDDLYQVAGTGTVNIEAMDPPGPFTISRPTQNEVIEEDYVIGWTSASRVDTFDMSIAKFINGIPEDPPSLIVTDLTSTNYQLSFATLERGATYQIEVVARNEVGERVNTDGPRVFMVKSYDGVGEFTVTSPNLNESVSGSPSFSWTASENAVRYDLNVLAEVNGQPSNDGAITISDLTTTFYQWQYAPLEGGQAYYYSVRAYGEGANNSRLNNRGLVRFLVSGLDDFTLMQPIADQEKVSLSPEFRWYTSSGAEKYFFELYGLPGDAPQYHFHSAYIDQGVGFISYTLPGTVVLSRGETYIWRVTAIRGEEEKVNSDGPRIFTTSQLQPFRLITPASFQPDVEPTPTFTWEPTITAESYTVEVAEQMENGEPNENTFKYSPPLSTTTWQWPYIDLERGKTYLWRVSATDGVNTIYSSGDYQPFTIMPLTEFNLVSPADLSTDVQTQPILQWEEVPLATSYRVHLLVEGQWYTYLEVPGNQHAVDLIDHDLSLASNTTYVWGVEALAEGVSLYNSYVWSFTTRERETITSCDIIDFLTKKQYFSDDDILIGDTGIISTPIDAATYILRSQFGDQCER